MRGESTYQLWCFFGIFGQHEKRPALDWSVNPDIWVALLTLTTLESVKSGKRSSLSPDGGA
jgi:hypothetical protein